MSIRRAARFAVLFLAALPACSSMTHSESPADWPALVVIERQVSVIDVQKKCFKYLTPAGLALSFGLTMGCAEIDFVARTCTIYTARGENDPGILEHEREHCAGKDHPGDATLRSAWERYSSALRGTPAISLAHAGLTIPDPGFTIPDPGPMAPALRAAYD
jgi:hypothetical protein